MAKNENLHKAKDAKKDEFYTQYEDIQNELNHYEPVSYTHLDVYKRQDRQVCWRTG